MKTSSDVRCADMRRLGYWQDRHTWERYLETAAMDPQRVAIKDPPNRDALVGGPARSLSFEQTTHHALRVASALHALGARRGDRVLMQMPNISESVLVLLAAARLGLVVSPVPMQYAEHEIRKVVSRLGPSIYVGVQQFKGEPVATKVADALPVDCRQLLLHAEAEDPTFRFGEAEVSIRSQTLPPEDLRGEVADETYTVCWTSGTTGTPKGVPRSHNLWLAQAASMVGIGIRHDDVMLCPFPLVNMASIAGFFYPWLLTGATLILHHPLELHTFLRQIHDEQVSYTVAPPALLNLLLGNPALLEGISLASVRLLCSGSAPLAPSMVAGFKQRYGIDVINIFGSNEGMALISSPEDVPDSVQRATLFPRFGVSGLRWSNPIAERIETRLVDPDTGKVVTEPGRPAEMRIRGPNVIDGYLTQVDDEAEVFDADGFFRSGDLFEIDQSDNRFYRFVGRCKDIINRGGMKISPDEIDTLLAGVSGIREAAVIGIPDPVMGERICAVVVPAEGVSISLERLTTYLHEQGLAKFKWPESLVLAKSLPRNPLGKVLRTEVATMVQNRGVKA